MLRHTCYHTSTYANTIIHIYSDTYLYTHLHTHFFLHSLTHTLTHTHTHTHSHTHPLYKQCARAKQTIESLSFPRITFLWQLLRHVLHTSLLLLMTFPDRAHQNTSITHNDGSLGIQFVLWQNAASKKYDYILISIKFIKMREILTWIKQKQKQKSTRAFCLVIGSSSFKLPLMTGVSGVDSFSG